MTTFQDPPPLSRRAARQSERNESSGQASQPQPYSFDPASASPASHNVSPVSPQRQSGRRANDTTVIDASRHTPQASPAPAAFDVYSQQNVPLHPAPVGSEPHGSEPHGSEPYGDASRANGEGRRSIISREQAQAASAASPVVASLPYPSSQNADEYPTRRSAAGRLRAAQPSAVDDSMDNTLSRRELRELRATAEAQVPALQLPETIDTLLHSGPIEIPTLAPPPGQSQALADAMAEFDLLTRARRAEQSRARDAQVATLTPVPPVPRSLMDAPPPRPGQQPSAPAYPPPAAVVIPMFVEPQAAASSVESPAVDSAPAGAGFAGRPTGHWSIQAEMQHDEVPYHNPLSRTVGTGISAITTSALVLPSVPQPGGTLSSITSTGEVLLTGTIDLPRSLAATGAHPHRVDSSDVDDDPLDAQIVSTDSAPVRAIRAVSTHASSGGVMTAKPHHGNRLLTAVIVTASVLCVAVVGFLVFAFMTNQI